MKKIQSKKKALEAYTLIFQTLMGKELLVSGEVLSKFKNEKDLFKNAQEWSQHFSNCNLWQFFKTIKGGLLCNPESGLAKIQTFMVVLITYIP